jgi:hypothetical protein
LSYTYRNFQPRLYIQVICMYQRECRDSMCDIDTQRPNHMRVSFGIVNSESLPACKMGRFPSLMTHVSILGIYIYILIKTEERERSCQRSTTSQPAQLLGFWCSCYSVMCCCVLMLYRFFRARVCVCCCCAGWFSCCCTDQCDNGAGAFDF